MKFIFQKLYNTAEKDMLLGQIQIFRRNEKIIKAFGPPPMRRFFRERCIPFFHGKPYEDKLINVRLDRNSSDDLERKIYDKCLK